MGYEIAPNHLIVRLNQAGMYRTVRLSKPNSGSADHSQDVNLIAPHLKTAYKDWSLCFAYYCSPVCPKAENEE